MNYNELVNAVININSLNELESLKNTLLTANQNNINQQLNLIRILSLEEYEKYIINGTCNGSIINNNSNVWHFPTMSYKNFLYTGSRSGGWINTSRFPGGYTESTAVPMGSDVTATIYSERFSNNSTSNSKYKFSVQVGIYNAYYYNPGVYVGAATVNYQNNDRSKTEAYIYSSARASHKVYNSTYNSKTFYYYVMHTFRPVFQYTDNKKSVNIFN